jgi:hypothetical protein
MPVSICIRSHGLCMQLIQDAIATTWPVFLQRIQNCMQVCCCPMWFAGWVFPLVLVPAVALLGNWALSAMSKGCIHTLAGAHPYWPCISPAMIFPRLTCGGGGCCELVSQRGMSVLTVGHKVSAQEATLLHSIKGFPVPHGHRLCKCTEQQGYRIL